MANTKYILPDLGDEIVTVVVGTCDKCKSFALHKNLVCKRSEFFRASLSGDWKESHERKVHLPEEDPDIFVFYMQSLYAGNTDQADSDYASEDGFRALGQLYVLADRLMDVHAKNHVVKAIFTLVKDRVVPSKFELCGGWADMIMAIWTVTSQDAFVRKLLVHSIVDFETLPYPTLQLEKVMSSLSRTPSTFLSTVVLKLIETRKKTRPLLNLEGYMEKIL